MDKIDIEKYDPVIEPIEDKLHRLTRAAAGSVPVVGSSLAEIVSAIITPPYEARTNAWLHILSKTMNTLIDSHNQTESSLRENNNLLSAIIRSSDIAVRTSSPEITQALSNALVSVALNQNLEEAIIAIYLNSASRLTSPHLKLLTYLSGLPEPEQTTQLTEKHQLLFFKSLSDYDKDFTDREITHRLTQDLINERILGLPDKASQSMSGPNFINMRLTQLGRDFVDFIAVREV